MLDGANILKCFGELEEFNHDLSSMMTWTTDYDIVV
jgi:hypothetical protein